MSHLYYRKTTMKEINPDYKKLLDQSIESLQKKIGELEKDLKSLIDARKFIRAYDNIPAPKKKKRGRSLVKKDRKENGNGKSTSG